MSFIKIIIWIAYLITLYFLVFWFINYIFNRKNIKIDLANNNPLKRIPFVSVIVPAYNEEKTIVKTLKSIVSLDYPKDKLEIVVVDDGSNDNTSKVVNSFINSHKKSNIKLIIQKNGGKANALNNALKVIKGEFFSCLDADSFVERKALKNMIRILLDDELVAVVTPVMRVDAPKNWIQKFQRIEYISSMLMAKLGSFLDCNSVAPGPFSTYRTKIIKKLGGFDENNLVEDQEIAYKIQKSHYKIRQCTNGFVRTISPNTVKALSKQRNRWVKGTFLTLFDYKHMIFNREYGDFGFFQLPITLAAYFLSLSALLSFVYYLIRPIFKGLKNLYLTGFDFVTYFKDWSFSFSILDLNFLSILVLYFSLFIAVSILYFAAKTTDDSLKEAGFFHVVPYFFVYFIILSFITLKVLLELIIGKKQTW